VCIPQELGATRRTQEDAVADKKTTPKKRWGVEQISKLLHLARILSKPTFPPMYTALAVGKGGSPRLHHPTEKFVVCSLEAGAAITSAPIVTSTTI